MRGVIISSLLQNENGLNICLSAPGRLEIAKEKINERLSRAQNHAEESKRRRLV